MGVEPCIICNAAARSKLPAGALQCLEEMLADTPHDCMPGIPCWNCFGAGYTGGSQEAMKERLREFVLRNNA